MELDIQFPNCDSSTSDLDLSFTSCASNTSTDRTFTSSSASARSSLTLSTTFNDHSLSSSSSSLPHRPHRRSDPHWSSISAATTLSPDGALHLHNLQLLRHLGSGNLGHVYLCRIKDLEGDANNFALKVVDKDALTHRKLSHVQMESEILSVVDHPYLPTLYAHLEASHYSCLLIDYCSNGDLHALLRKQPSHRFSIDAVRFFASEVLVALEYLHAMGFVYRDLKPENVLIREDGHIMLSDFDLCFKADVSPTVTQRLSTKKNNNINQGSTFSTFFSCFGSGKEDERLLTEFSAEPVGASSRSCVGTHEYLAPELVNGNGHGNGVDWWAFGVFIHELMYGKTPFKGESKELTLRNISSGKQVVFPVPYIEEDRAREAKDLISKLLVRDTATRLGCARGATEIKGHPFFKGIKWPLIRTYKVPEVKGLERRKTSTCHVSGKKKVVRACKSLGEGRSWSVKYVAGVMRRAVSFNQ